jgi:hypothetical protein
MDRWVNLHPIDAPVELQVGDEVIVEIDVRPATYFATWVVRVCRGDDVLVSERRSTLLGVFISPTELGHG